jgi:hypothetical protein
MHPSSAVFAFDTDYQRARAEGHIGKTNPITVHIKVKTALENLCHTTKPDTVKDSSGDGSNHNRLFHRNACQ